MHKMKLLIQSDFNTSHVTVYQVSAGACPAEVPFQYISCYGLSWFSVAPVFANIISIHLMLRFIADSLRKLEWILVISIHLMLRFILCQCPVSDSRSEFQYISCYGLSKFRIFLFYSGLVFQYISCYGLSIMRC